MAIYYLDSSALVKRYVPEIGSEWIKSLFLSNDNRFLTTKISIVEVISAFARKHRENIFSEDEFNELVNNNLYLF